MVRRRLVRWTSPPIDPFDSACHFILKNKKSLIEMSDFSFFKAPIRIELMNKGFADLCLTAWLWRHIKFTDTIFHVRELFGADYGARTRHLDLGKVALYQMS